MDPATIMALLQAIGAGASGGAGVAAGSLAQAAPAMASGGGGLMGMLGNLGSGLTGGLNSLSGALKPLSNVGQQLGQIGGGLGAIQSLLGGNKQPMQAPQGKGQPTPFQSQAPQITPLQPIQASGGIGQFGGSGMGGSNIMQLIQNLLRGQGRG